MKDNLKWTDINIIKSEDGQQIIIKDIEAFFVNKEYDKNIFDLYCVVNKKQFKLFTFEDYEELENMVYGLIIRISIKQKKNRMDLKTNMKVNVLMKITVIPET